MKLANKVYAQMLVWIEAEALLLGFKPFPKDSGQLVWAKSEEQSKQIQWGDSVYRFLPKRLQMKLDLAMKVYMKLQDGEDYGNV